jgi:hypothetical protein
MHKEKENKLYNVGRSSMHLQKNWSPMMGDLCPFPMLASAYLPTILKIIFKNFLNVQEFPAFRSYLPKYYEGQNWIFEVLEVQKSQ